MVLLDDIATIIVSGSTVMKLGGTTATLGKAVMLDTEPDTISVLFEQGGVGSAFTFSTSTGRVEEVLRYPTVQVLSRSGSYQTARAHAEIIYGILNGLGSTVVAGTTYDSVVAIQPPFSVGRDKSDRYLVSCNYRITVRT